MPSRRAALFALLGLLQLAWTRDRIVLLVENRSTNPAAAAEITPALAEQLGSMGYEVVPAAEVASALVDAAIHDAGEIGRASADRLRAAVKAEAVIAVTVSFFLDSRARPRGPKASPAFGLSAAFWGPPERRAWSNSLGWIADEVSTPAAFGFKRGPPKPTALACERLLWSLPRGRKDPTAVLRPQPSAEETAPPTYTRWTAPLRRRRDFSGIAHFPLRVR